MPATRLKYVPFWRTWKNTSGDVTQQQNVDKVKKSKVNLYFILVAIRPNSIK